MKTPDQEIVDKIAYVVNHEPIRYVVKFKFPFWYIMTLDGHKAGMHLSKIGARVQCNLLNSVYGLGYSLGAHAVIKVIKEK